MLHVHTDEKYHITVLASPEHYIKRECTRDPITHYIFLFSQLSGKKLNQVNIGHASAFGWGLIRRLKLKIVNNFSVQHTKMEKPCYHYFYIHTPNMECRDSRRDKLLLCSHIPSYTLATPI